MRDFLLVHVFAGASLCLPALLHWQQRFATSPTVSSTHEALAAVSRVLICWHDESAFQAVNWCSELAAIGIDPNQLGIDEHVEITGELDEDQIDAIRMLVPPSRLLLQFQFGLSGLDLSPLG